MQKLTDHAWEDVDELIEQVKGHAAEDQWLPESIALIYYDDGLSAFLSTPPFLVETADEVTDALCHVLPPFRVCARGITVVWPAMYEGEDQQYWAMKVHKWDATEPDRMRTQVWPVPILGTPDGAPMDVDAPSDPWSRRLAGALTEPSPLADLGVLDTTGLGEGFELRFAPGRTPESLLHSTS